MVVSGMLNKLVKILFLLSLGCLLKQRDWQPTDEEVLHLHLMLPPHYFFTKISLTGFNAKTKYSELSFLLVPHLLSCNYIIDVMIFYLFIVFKFPLLPSF